MFISVIILTVAAAVAAAPARAAAPPEPPAGTWTLIVIPRTDREGASDPDWLSVLEAFPEARLTLALSPADLARIFPLRQRLIHWKDQGRLEPALRLSGDPPLPLICDLDLSRIYLNGADLPSIKMAWQGDAFSQILKAKSGFRTFFGDDPKGFVPGGGSLNLALADFLKVHGFAWTVGGFPENEWPEGEFVSLGDPPSLAILRAHPLSLGFYSRPPGPDADSSRASWVSGLLKTARESGTVCYVYDETRAQISLSDFMKEVKSQNAASAAKAAMELGARPRAARAGAAAQQVWPYSWPWVQGTGSPRGPGLTAWMGDPDKNRAWELAAQVRADVERYKNSGEADLARLDRAMDEFSLALSGGWFESFGSEGAQPRPPREAQEKNENLMLFKATLANVYRRLGWPVPDAVRQFRFRGASVETLPAEGSAASAPEAREFRISSRRDAKSGAASWFQSKKQKDGRTYISRFSVRSSTRPEGGDFVVFAFAFSGRPATGAALDLYIDINHRPGAGSTALLEGRDAAVLSERDAWEYVLVSRRAGSTWESRLIRSGGSAPFYSTRSLEKKAAPGSAAFEVRIPKSLLGADPSGWGYLAWLAQPEGGPALDILSPWEGKDALLSPPEDPKDEEPAPQAAELPALRLEH